MALNVRKTEIRGNRRYIEFDDYSGIEFPDDGSIERFSAEDARRMAVKIAMDDGAFAQNADEKTLFDRIISFFRF